MLIRLYKCAILDTRGEGTRLSLLLVTGGQVVSACDKQRIAGPQAQFEEE